MSLQLIFSITYVPFVILIAMSCIYEGKISVILKRLSVTFGLIAIISYFFFIKNLI